MIIRGKLPFDFESGKVLKTRAKTTSVVDKRREGTTFAGNKLISLWRNGLPWKLVCAFKGPPKSPTIDNKDQTITDNACVVVLTVYKATSRRDDNNLRFASTFKFQRMRKKFSLPETISCTIEVWRLVVRKRTTSPVYLYLSLLVSSFLWSEGLFDRFPTSWPFQREQLLTVLLFAHCFDCFAFLSPQVATYTVHTSQPSLGQHVWKAKLSVASRKNYEMSSRSRSVVKTQTNSSIVLWLPQ